MKRNRPYTQRDGRLWREFMSAGASTPEPARAKPVQHERAEQAALSKWARSMWWGLGYRHHEQASMSGAQRLANYHAGLRTGWPDVTVHVPAPLRLCLAVELKSPTKKPKRDMDIEWWLRWRPNDGSINDNPTRRGLMWSQAWTLQVLHSCGYRTYVAYSAHDAFDWINWQCGHEPAGGVRWP